MALQRLMGKCNIGTSCYLDDSTLLRATISTDQINKAKRNIVESAAGLLSNAEKSEKLKKEPMPETGDKIKKYSQSIKHQKAQDLLSGQTILDDTISQVKPLEMKSSLKELFNNLSTVNNPRITELKSAFEAIKKGSQESLSPHKGDINVFKGRQKEELTKIRSELQNIFHTEMQRLTRELKCRSIRCILFDLGDTLWTSVNEASSNETEQNVNQRAIDFLSQSLTLEQQTMVKASYDDKSLRKAIHDKIYELIRLHPEVEPKPVVAVRETLQELGLPSLNDHICEDLFEALRIRITESRVLFDETRSTLEELRRRGFLLGVVSNRPWGGEPFLEDLQQLGLLKYFDPRHIAVSADLGVRKPSPNIFLHVINAIEVKPEETVMVGDSLYADIYAKIKLKGMSTVWLPNPKRMQGLKTKDIISKNTTHDQPFDEINPHQLSLYLNSARKYENEHYRVKFKPALPDATIMRVSDLLDILQRAGD